MGKVTHGVENVLHGVGRHGIVDEDRIVAVRRQHLRPALDGLRGRKRGGGLIRRDAELGRDRDNGERIVNRELSRNAEGHTRQRVSRERHEAHAGGTQANILRHIVAVIALR